MRPRGERPLHPQLSDAWKAELDRRGAQIDSGEVKMIDHHEVMARVRERLRAAEKPSVALHLPKED